MNLRQQLRDIAPQISAAMPVWLLTLVVLTIALTVTETLGLSAAQTSSWILALFGIPAALGIILSLLYRQPYIWTGHALALILFGSLSGEASFPELVGASVIAGALVLVLGAAGSPGLSPP